VPEVVKRIMNHLLTYKAGKEYSWIGFRGKRKFGNTAVAEAIIGE